MSVRSLGRLTIDLVARVGGFVAGMGQAERETERRTKAMRNHLRGLQTAFNWLTAGAGAAGLAATIGRAISLGDELNKAAIKAGISGEAISELAHAAKMADVDLAGLSNALRFMQTNLSEAASGGKAPLKTLQALGIELEKIRQLAADQQFEVIAEQISKLKDPADRARAATELFGRAGADLLPLFEDGARGIRKAREEAERLGISLTGQQIENLAEADDAIKRMNASWQSLADTLASKVAPIVGFTADLLSGKAFDNKSTQAQIFNLEGQLGFFRKNLEVFEKRGDAEAVAGISARIRDIELRLYALKTIDDDFAARRARALSPNTAPPGFEDGASTEAFDKLEASLQEQIALYGKVGEAAKVAYQTQFGALKDLDDAQKQRLISLAKEYDGIVAVAEAAEKAAKEEEERREKELRARHRDMEILADTKAELEDEALRSGEESTDRMFANSMQYIGVVHEDMMKMNREMPYFAQQAADDARSAFQEFFFEPTIDGIKDLGRELVDTLRRSIAIGLEDALFGSKADGGLGWGDAIAGFVSGAFGGGRAEGGPIEQGKWYIAGEHGPEPIWGGGPGAYAMGYATPGKAQAGSARAVNITNNIDARGSTVESVKLLQAAIPAVIRESVNQATANVMSQLDRRGMSF